MKRPKGIVIDVVKKEVYRASDMERLYKISDFGELNYDTGGRIQHHNAFDIFGVLHQYGLHNLCWHYLRRRVKMADIKKLKWRDNAIFIIDYCMTFISTFYDVKEAIDEIDVYGEGLNRLW